MSIAGTCAVCALERFGLLTGSQMKSTAADQSFWRAGKYIAKPKWPCSVGSMLLGVHLYIQHVICYSKSACYAGYLNFVFQSNGEFDLFTKN